VVTDSNDCNVSLESKIQKKTNIAPHNLNIDMRLGDTNKETHEVAAPVVFVFGDFTHY
jgi:hypothetical protein